MTPHDSLTPLHQIAAERGFSLSRLARETGMRPSTVSTLWHGHRVPRRSSLQKLASVLEVDWQHLDPHFASHDDAVVLRTALAATGLSIHQLAKEAGLAYQTIQNLWHGSTTPQEKTLQKIAEVLEVDWRQLRTAYLRHAQRAKPTSLQQLAEAHGYSISDLAQATQISFVTLLGAWYGRSRPQQKTLHKIAEVLGVDWRSLLPKDTQTPDQPLPPLVRQLAQARSLSARQLARQAGLGYVTVLNVWHGKRVPHKKTLHKLAAALNIDWQELQGASAEAR